MSECELSFFHIRRGDWFIFWQQFSSVLLIGCYVHLMVVATRLVFSFRSLLFFNYFSGWICCTTWFAWFRCSLLFSRVVRIFFNVTRFSHDFISFLVAEQISILRLLENPFPSHSWILYWRWMLLRNGTHQMSLHLIGSCGMELTKCFLMWLNLVHRIFDQWERLVHCWKDASEFFYWFVWCYLLICLRQLLGECFWDCGAVMV